MEIRKATEKDADGIWEIFAAVIQTGDTYVFVSNTPRSDLAKHWFAENMQTFVAIESGEIVGTYIVKPNQQGRGSHVANAGYMVKPEMHGRGIGRKMCEHSLQIAKESGYLAMQFNIVVSTNERAVALWKKCGFRIVGVVPSGFRHEVLGLVDTYIMYRAL